ncbi:hypothetical protein E2C01_038779 [Portunus trituberculatus]|uniref:Uncharacterized protein n=1 Tax=Portunus trituberculatus TaxID=210409 RepID=A0A5B7FIY3_PORTR|nr:hypothetical protein [Portunus trituberculatus]
MLVPKDTYGLYGLPSGEGPLINGDSELQLYPFVTPNKRNHSYRSSPRNTYRAPRPFIYGGHVEPQLPPGNEIESVPDRLVGIFLLRMTAQAETSPMIWPVIHRTVLSPVRYIR